ncbi:MAG: sulfite exporter TauE/SafE family protein [Flavisolibacter sp.]
MSWTEILLLCCAAFAAGFVDAIVGGGGLIQLPAALVILPAVPVVNVIGSLKIPAFSGTAFAAWQYIKKVNISWKLVSVICTVAFFSSFAGSELLTHVSNDFMKPVLLVVLSAVALYTFFKKGFGLHEEKDHSSQKQLVLAGVISLVIGFYDGFIGPGAGSFLILAFITVLGFDFLHASAHAKLINLATNLGSVTLFFLHGDIIWAIAIPMAVCNAAGGILGARTAISRGNKFIRAFFLFIVIAILLRFAYDVFIKH